MDVVITPKTGHANISPYAFHMWATHYYKCKHDFISPDKFSPVPYFLLCRAIELALKSKHLNIMTRSDIKKTFGHDLIKSYKALDSKHKILTSKEYEVLLKANKIYNGKEFEYFNPYHALRGYKDFPDLGELDAIALRLIDNG